MMKENQLWTTLLFSPDIPSDMPGAELYHAACIGAVMLLRESCDNASLADVVRYSPVPEIRNRALASLISLALVPNEGFEAAVRQLYILAVRDAVPGAVDFLRKGKVQDSDPGWYCAGLLVLGQKHHLLKIDPKLQILTDFYLASDEPLKMRLLQLGEKVLPNWTLFMGFLDDPSESNRAELLKQYAVFSREEKELVRYCIGSDDPVSSLPADLMLRYDDPYAAELCLQNNLRPSDPSMEAVFFFLTGQWERYYASDSDYRRIRIAYEQNDPELQRRLITAGRESGNNAWLRQISGTVENGPGRGTLTDQRLMIESLIEQNQPQRLWDLLPNVPLYCMPLICSALREAGFQPDHADEKAFLDKVNEDVEACIGMSPIPVRHTLAKESGTIVGLCVGGPYIAALYADRRILVWYKERPEEAPFLINSNRLNFRRAVISHDGKYLCADCGNEGLVIFSLPAGQIVKALPGRGPSLAGLFLQKDSRRLITISQNGLGTVYSFPGGTELFSFDLTVRDVMRSAYDPETNHICGVALGGLSKNFDLTRLRLSSEFDLGETPAAIAETFEHGLVSVIGQGNTLSSFNLFSGRYLLERIVVGPEIVRRLFGMNSGELYLLGDTAGRIRVFEPAADTFHAVLSFGNKTAVTGICYDEKNEVLYGCTSGGAVRSWDLWLFNHMIRVLPLRDLPGLKRLDEYCKKYPEPGVKAAAEWLKTIVAWRKRFDIEVDFDF